MGDISPGRPPLCHNSNGMEIAIIPEGAELSEMVHVSGVTCPDAPQKQEILTEVGYFLATWELAGQGQ